MIQVNNLTFGYEGSFENVFEDIFFNFDTDWKLGLIGRNGKGKTTFLKLLLGKYKYSGTISKKVEFDYFPFEISDKQKLAIEIANEIVPSAEDWEIIKELRLLNTEAEILYKNFNLLSGGEQVKVLLVSLFLKENNFLLIDEPTNHLDYQSKKEVEKYLKSKKGFILVSHDRNLLNNVVDHIISINNKNIDIQKGNYDLWKENKDREDNFEINKNEKLKKDILRLETSSKSAQNWSNIIEKSKNGETNSGSKVDKGYIGHQSAKMMKKSKVLENRKNKEIEEKEQLLKNIDRADDLIIKPLEFNKRNLIIANEFQVRYTEEPIFKKLNFEININDRVALIGKNGSGKTSIINLLVGKKIPYLGNFSIANNLKISYVSQSTNEINGSLNDYARRYKVDEAIFRAMLFKLGVETKGFERDISLMSEGQKKKILIARSISESANLYIWDEPLNYVDIISREQIEKMLLKYRPTIIFTEHDDTFRKKLQQKQLN